MKRHSFINKQNGATAVEMAIILPLLFLLIFGIIEYSIVLYDKAMIANAAREGARFGVMWAPMNINDKSYRYSVQNIRDRVNNWLNDNLISFSSSDITDIKLYRNDVEISDPDTILCVNTDDIINIRIIYKYSYLIPYFFKNSIDLSYESKMKCEH